MFNLCYFTSQTPAKNDLIFIFILKQIEDGIIDQYDASVKVGTILREMYVDSAMRRGDNLDKKYEGDAPTFVEPVKMSWNDFKKKTL